MNRAYPRRNASRKAALKQWSTAFVSLIFGYLLAAVCDINTVNKWFNQYALNKTPAPKEVVKNEPPPKPKLEFYTLLTKEGEVVASSEVAAIPSSSDKAIQSAATTSVVSNSIASNSVAGTTVDKSTTVIATAPTPVVTATPASVQPPTPTKPVEPIIDRKNAFLVQVAAFKNRRDAEKLQANLILKGFDVSLTTVNQPTGNWYRVVMGPFSSREQAQKAQTSMARSERIMGMIRKMEV